MSDRTLGEHEQERAMFLLDKALYTLQSANRSNEWKKDKRNAERLVELFLDAIRGNGK